MSILVVIWSFLVFVEIYLFLLFFSCACPLFPSLPTRNPETKFLHIFSILLTTKARCRTVSILELHIDIFVWNDMGMEAIEPTARNMRIWNTICRHLCHHRSHKWSSKQKRYLLCPNGNLLKSFYSLELKFPHFSLHFLTFHSVCLLQIDFAAATKCIKVTKINKILFYNPRTVATFHMCVWTYCKISDTYMPLYSESEVAVKKNKHFYWKKCRLNADIVKNYVNSTYEHKWNDKEEKKKKKFEVMKWRATWLYRYIDYDLINIAVRSNKKRWNYRYRFREFTHVLFWSLKWHEIA